MGAWIGTRGASIQFNSIQLLFVYFLNTFSERLPLDFVYINNEWPRPFSTFFFKLVKLTSGVFTYYACTPCEKVIFWYAKLRISSMLKTMTSQSLLLHKHRPKTVTELCVPKYSLLKN